ncbi:hypothetical protein ONS95_004780 [Cadophora gregata]|uniref:uncharacterized protein n=1 Tax=Cadophora gregata TaxID=51156 RepID=UPI0026DBC6D6|nr:uncharacterized protein ONS95_004780 [Cadophora gregata]KAK0104492.1 hypothetical protein ONS95_004780 [Cadophora gregata]KAK0115416.1 hypothetical protein ONS96_013872 [Cadophora gregata f. sp. sojae]
MANHSVQHPSKMDSQHTVQYPPVIQAYPTELYRRSSSSDESRLVKKPRASKPKVKSGCVTCKARRVKCDETKPHCLRCQKFGRICDGYTPEPAQSRGLSQLQPRIPSSSLYGPSVAIHATEEEHRYFQVFTERTAHELSGFYDPTFWTKLVLQESHSVAAIRHSVIALGALNKSLESAPGPNLKVNVIQSIDKRHHEQAVLAHLKAIQSLNSYISSSGSPQLRNALIACLLFVCFETFQGCYASSVQQIYGGLKILRSYYMGKPGSRPWIPRRGAVDSLRFKSGHVAKVSNSLQTREGCDNVSKDRAIAQHVEDYLENENYSRTDLTDENSNLIAAYPRGDLAKSLVHDPEFLIRHMGGTEFQQTPVQKDQQKRSSHAPLMPSPMERQFSEGRSSAGNPSPEALTYCGMKQLSSSNPTTPTTYTPPSTAPPTPSTLIPVPSQNSTAAPAPITSRKRPLASRSPTPVPLLQNDLTIEEVLIQSFVRLDGSGLFFGMVPGIPPLVWDTHQIWHLPIPAAPFTHFPTAQRCWDFLMDRTLQFYRRTLFNRRYAPSTSDPPALITKQYNMHTKQLSLFDKAFAPLLKTAILPDGTVTNAAALILSLNLKCTAIMLATVQNESEMLYDDYIEDFAYIVRTCKKIVAEQDSLHLPRNTRFSFDTGIVPPLHVTASKCRNPVIRREAIALLFSSPRQEGMWDGVLSARIGRWLAGCEEDGLPEPPLPSPSTSTSPESSTSSEMRSYPSPPRIVEDKRSVGGWEAGRRISEVVNEMHGSSDEYGAEAYGPGAKRHAHSGFFSIGEQNGNGSLNGKANGKAKAVPSRKKSRTTNGNANGNGNINGSGSGWYVPEQNRVQLMVVDFHLPERYIKVKCQRALPGRDGKREERETVIAW